MSTTLTTNQRTSLRLALFALLTGSAMFAGAVAGAVGATTGTVNQIGIATVGSVHSTMGGVGAATVNTNGSAGAAGSSVTTVNAAYGLPAPAAGASAHGSTAVSANANLAAAGTDYDTIGMREERLQMRADAAASKDIKAIGQVVSNVRTTAYSDRDKIDSAISDSLNETKRALASDEAHVSSAAKSDYDAARSDVRARESELSDSLKTARAATQAHWEAARDDVAVSYSLYATAAMRSRVIAAQGSASASAALDPAGTVAAVRSADLTAREQVSRDVRSKLAASEKALDAARAESKTLGNDAKEGYYTAVRVAAHREREVKNALSSADKAAGSTWTQARNDVALAYADYAEAVSRAELAATAEGTTDVAAKSTPVQTASTGTLVASAHN